MMNSKSSIPNNNADMKSTYGRINQRIVSSIYIEIKEKKLAKKQKKRNRWFFRGLNLRLRARNLKNFLKLLPSKLSRLVFYSILFKKLVLFVSNSVLNISHKRLNSILRIINILPGPLKRKCMITLNRGFRTKANFLRISRQNEAAFHFSRVIRILFYSQYSEETSWERKFYLTASINIGNARRICNEYKNAQKIVSPCISGIIGRAFLLDGDHKKAEKFLKYSISKDMDSPESLKYYGIVLALLGKIAAAKKIFLHRIMIYPHLFIPHQNLAARYDLYIPSLKNKHLSNAGSFQIYDQLNFIAEQFFLFGKLHASMNAYRQALVYQKKINKNFNLPYELTTKLRQYVNFDYRKSSVILPVEWITQIGHIALLDIFLKIEKTERKRDCNYIVLAPRSMVANMHYLSYWKSYFIIIYDEDLIQELLPYQRYCGEGFMPFLHKNEMIEPWTRVGARAQMNWHAMNRKPLLSLTHEDRAYGQEKLISMGLPENSWFTVVHVREGTFHKEMKGGASDHRNANINQYLKSLEEITRKGGWVIRMGDAKMTPLPPMKNVIDYALSPYKSERMDIFLSATARLFIGTTSGLTTTALSFDTPVLLLNIISNDWQLWSDKTHFIPKMVYDKREKRIVTFSEVYASDDRNLLIKQNLIDQRGWEIIQNTEEDILEAVRYKLEVLEGKPRLTHIQKKLVERYNLDMANEPYMFGAAHIVPNFIERHPYMVSSL